MEKSNIDYQKEIEAYQKKIKGYEILNTLYKKNLDQCKSQKLLIKEMDERMKELEKQLEESEKKGLDFKMQTFCDTTSAQLQFNVSTILSKDQESLKDFVNDDNNGEKKQSNEFEGSEVSDPGGIEFGTSEDISQWPGDRRKDFRRSESKSSSFSSFVKVNESPVGDDADEFKFNWNDDDEDAPDSKMCDQFSENIVTLVDPKEKARISILEESPRNATLEIQLKALMEKLKFIEPSRNVPQGQGSDFFTDITHLTKKMLQFYGRSQAIQMILEKFEKENKELKAQLNFREGMKIEQVGVESIDEEKIEMKQRIAELTSCKQALMNMMENKDKQLLQLKHHVRSLKMNVEKMKLACSRISACSQENSRKWQKDYSKLQEQLKKVYGERDHETQEVVNLKSEVKHLKRRLEDLMHLKLVTESDRHDSSEVDILKQQIAIYMEDFKNERQDREKAQALVEKLKKKLDGLSKSFSELSTENTKLLENYHCAITKQQTPNTARIFRVTNQRGPNCLGTTLHPTAPQENSIVHSIPWQCPSCTFINNGWITYCMACDQSRY